jgi:hypothetical protein
MKTRRRYNNQKGGIFGFGNSQSCAAQDETIESLQKQLVSLEREKTKQIEELNEEHKKELWRCNISKKWGGKRKSRKEQT